MLRILILLGAAVVFILPGHIDSALITEFGDKLPPSRLPSPRTLNLLRAAMMLAGAGLASRVIARRRRLGLEDKPPYDDFP